MPFVRLRLEESICWKEDLVSMSNEVRSTSGCYEIYLLELISKKHAGVWGIKLTLLPRHAHRLWVTGKANRQIEVVVNQHIHPHASGFRVRAKHAEWRDASA
jgi:hypothetical protein